MSNRFYLSSCGILVLASLGMTSFPAAPQPRMFEPGVICTGAYETHPAFSPSGDTLYFLTCSPDLASNTICVSYRRGGKWSKPEVASFSGKYVDADPFVSKDGRTLYFISDRPVRPNDPAKSDMDIWRVVREGSHWSAPQHLQGPVNSSEDEYYPTLTDNGTLYFGSARAGGQGASDLYHCSLAGIESSAVENLGPAVNTPGSEYEPFIAPDESYLLFIATRPQGLKNADLYLSYRQGNGWTPAQKLPPPFNSASTEFSPKVSRDGRMFYFASARPTFPNPLLGPENLTQLRARVSHPGNGLGDIYQIEASALPLTRPE